MLRVERLTKIFENATDAIAGGIREASFALEPRHLLHAARPLRLRQDHDAALHRGPRNARRRRDRGRRPHAVRRQGARERAGRAARGRDGVPVLRDLAAHDGRRERRVSRSRSRRAGAIRAPRSRTASSARSRSSISTGSRSGRRRGCRAASSSAWRSRARSCTSRGLLLLDEPLSNLDAQLRDDMRGELKRLQSKIGITTVYVTHDQSEALALSDRIAVIDRGHITQIGSPQDIYFRPANPFVARFVGATNLLDRPPHRRTPTAAAKSRCSAAAISNARSRRRSTITSSVSVSIRPESITLVARADGAAARGQLPRRPHQRRHLPRRRAPGRCRQRRREPPGHHARRHAVAGRRRGAAGVRA